MYGPLDMVSLSGEKVSFHAIILRAVLLHSRTMPGGWVKQTLLTSDVRKRCSICCLFCFYGAVRPFVFWVPGIYQRPHNENPTLFQPNSPAKTMFSSWSLSSKGGNHNYQSHPEGIFVMEIAWCFCWLGERRNNKTTSTSLLWSSSWTFICRLISTLWWSLLLEIGSVSVQKPRTLGEDSPSQSQKANNCHRACTLSKWLSGMAQWNKKDVWKPQGEIVLASTYSNATNMSVHLFRGDHTSVDFYLTVLPPKTECVVFSIDGSFTASVSIMGKDPKVRAGAVDVVRWEHS